MSAIASDGGVISRQLEKNLYRSFISELSDYEGGNLESIMADSYEFPIKQIFNIDLAKIDSRYGVAGFQSIGFKVDDTIDIIKMNELGLWEQGKQKVVGPVTNWYVAEEFLKSLPEEAFNEDNCYYSGIMALYSAILSIDDGKDTFKRKEEILNELKGHIEIVHVTKEREVRNSKLSTKKVDNIIDNIIKEQIYRQLR